MISYLFLEVLGDGDSNIFVFVLMHMNLKEIQGSPPNKHFQFGQKTQQQSCCSGKTAFLWAKCYASRPSCGDREQHNRTHQTEAQWIWLQQTLSSWNNEFFPDSEGMLWRFDKFHSSQLCSHTSLGTDPKRDLDDHFVFCCCCWISANWNVSCNTTRIWINVHWSDRSSALAVQQGKRTNNVELSQRRVSCKTCFAQWCKHTKTKEILQQNTDFKSTSTKPEAIECHFEDQHSMNVDENQRCCDANKCNLTFCVCLENQLIEKQRDNHQICPTSCHHHAPEREEWFVCKPWTYWITGVLNLLLSFFRLIGHLPLETLQQPLWSRVCKLKNALGLTLSIQKIAPL